MEPTTIDYKFVNPIEPIQTIGMLPGKTIFSFNNELFQVIAMNNALMHLVNYYNDYVSDKNKSNTVPCMNITQGVLTHFSADTVIDSTKFKVAKSINIAVSI